jgi:hypothetical protein
MPVTRTRRALGAFGAREPRLKVNDDQQVDEDDREGEAGEQLAIRLIHRRDLAAHHNPHAFPHWARDSSRIFWTSSVTPPRSRLWVVHVFCSRHRSLTAKRDENIGIDDADGARVAISQIRAGEWQSNIVDGT